MLYVFGESFAKGQCSRNGVDFYLDRPYGKILGENLNTEVLIKAFGGASCMDVINLLTSNMDNFSKGDTVILAIPPLSRINLPVATIPATAKVLGSRRNIQNIDIHSYRTLTGFAIAHFLFMDAVNSSSIKKSLFNYFKKCLDPAITDNDKQLQEFVNNFSEFYVNLNHGTEENYKTYYYSWIDNLSYFFIKHKINFIAYSPEWWDYIADKFPVPVENKCECNHWSEFHHEMFAETLLDFINNKSGDEYLMELV